MSDHYTIDLQLASTSRAPGLAREYVQEHSDHLPTELVRDAELLVSELVTNAVLHGRPQIRLRIALDPPVIGVSVIDNGAPFSPPSESAPDDQGHGRGLQIVAAMARRSGIERLSADTGKAVWFELSARDYEPPLAPR